MFSNVSGGIERENWTEISLKRFQIYQVSVYSLLRSRCHISLFQKKLDITGSLQIVRSFVEFVPHVLELYRVDYFLSDKLNQDLVEEHFSRIRSRGGGSDNSTLEQYGYINRKVIVAKSEMIQVTKGNTRSRVKENRT